jgi:hypothetical protein
MIDRAVYGVCRHSFDFENIDRRHQTGTVQSNKHLTDVVPASRLTQIHLVVHT